MYDTVRRCHLVIGQSFYTFYFSLLSISWFMASGQLTAACSHFSSCACGPAEPLWWPSRKLLARHPSSWQSTPGNQKRWSYRPSLCHPLSLPAPALFGHRLLDKVILTPHHLILLPIIKREWSMRYHCGFWEVGNAILEIFFWTPIR